MEKRSLKSHPASMSGYLSRHDWYRVRDCHYYFDTCLQSHKTSMTETGCKKLLQKEMGIWGPLPDLFEKLLQLPKLVCIIIAVFPLKSISILLSKNDDKALKKKEFWWSWQHRNLAVFFTSYIVSPVRAMFFAFTNKSFFSPILSLYEWLFTA